MAALPKGVLESALDIEDRSHDDALASDITAQTARLQQQQALQPPTPQWSLPSLDALLGGGTTQPAPETPQQAVPTQQPWQEQRTQGWQLPSLDVLLGRDPNAAQQQPVSSGVPSSPFASPGGTPVAMPTASQDGQAVQAPPARPVATGGNHGEIDNSSRQAFIRTAYPYMLEAAGGDQNLAELMLAKAISENGSIGTGRPIWANNVSGIKGEGDAGSIEADTWEDYGNGPVNIRDRFAAYSTPQAGFRAFMQFLHDNSRYAPALARYQQTRDASQLFRDILAAGYATDKAWADKVESIRANQVAPIVRGQSNQDMPRLSLNAAPAAAPGRAAPPAPAGVSSAPAGAPPAPWEMPGAQDGGQMLLKENDETAPPSVPFLPGDGGFSQQLPQNNPNLPQNSPFAGPGDGGVAPQTFEQPYDPDQGPREATPGSVGAQPLPQTDQNYPMAFGPVEQGEVQGPPAPAQSGPLKPVWDAAGRVIGYVQGAADSLYQSLEPARQAAAALDAGDQYGQVQSVGPGEPDYVDTRNPVMRALYTPIRTPERQQPMMGPFDLSNTTAFPDQQSRQQYRNAQPGLAEDVRDIPYQAAESARTSVQEAARAFADALIAGQDGRQLASSANALWGLVQTVALPWSVVERTINAMLPEMNIAGVGVGTAATSMDLLKLGINGVNGLVKFPERLSPEGLAAMYDAPGNAARAVGGAARTAGNVVREGAESLGRGLQGVGREVAAGLMDLNPGMAPRIIGDGPGIGRSMPGPDDVPTPSSLTPPAGGRPQQRTVEWLAEQIDYTRRVLDDLDPNTERELIGQVQDRLARLQGEWVDAVNARRALEPRIRSEVGRRVNELPIDERTASDYAGIGRERVSPEAGIPRTVDDTPRSPGLNSAIPGFDPASAAAGGAAGALSEGEDGEQGDPLRTAAGIGLGAFGARIARKPGHTVATGLKPGQRYEFRVRVVPLRELITSHLDNLAENPRFLGELQPRVRSRAASRVQIDKLVQAFDPEQVLMDTHRVDSGPMIVGPDMMVESGNGRAIALRRLSQENPEAYADYVQALREELPYYGLTDDALQGIDQPVLVRERVTPLDDAERARFASEANAPQAAQMSSMEQALADARNIGDGPLGRIVVGEDQTIDEALLSPENGAFVRAFMATVPDTERGKMLEANGNLSVTGLARVKAALLARTYPGAAGERVATAIVESTDAGLRNVQNAVMGSLPSMARVEGLIAAGDVDAGLSLADDIAAAVDVYARLKRAGILVGDYLQQAGMFGGRETTPLQDAILGYLNENARAPRRLRSLLEGYAREVEATAGSAGDMFGGPATTATKEELLDGVLRRLGAAPGADQGADVGGVGATRNVVEGAAGRPIQVPGADPVAEAGRGAGGPSLLDDVAAAETLTPEQQIARLQAENDRLRAERRGGGRRQQPPQAAPLGDANLPPVGDDLIPPTGGPEGTLAREGAPEPPARPTPIPRDVLPPTGGEAGPLAQEGAPVPFARPGALPADAVPATGGPEGRLRVQEDRQAVEQLMADSAGARRYDEAQRRQISDATARYAEDVRTLSERIAGERAAGNTPDRLMAERAAVASRLHATMQLAEGRRGAAARAFREADRQAELLRRDPKRAVEQMHKRFGGQENAAAAADEYTRMVEDGATPIQLARFWAGVERGKITGADLFALFRRFNMLSGPRTIEVNALSGALNLGYEVLSQAGGQLVRGRGAEAAAEMAAPFKAMGRAFGNLAETMRHGVSAEQAARGDIPRTLSSRTDNRAAKGVLTAMEMPDRFNAAVDQFYRTMTEDWAATMLAHKRARADGLNPRSDGWADAVAKHLQEIRDDVDVLPEIKQMADHVTFAEEPGGIGRGLEEFRRRAPLVANVLFPFIRTPYNIASRAVDLSPLGVVRTGAEVLTGRGRGRENVSRRVRDNALGLAAAYWAYDQAQQGNVTGAGPDDPEKRAMLMATGWRPYSVKIGGEYWSYANFAPFSLALAMGAAAHEAKQYAKPGEDDTLSLLGDAAIRTGKVVTEMTVLQGIGAIIKSIEDPDRYGGQWLTQFLGSLVPAGSLLNTIGQATDDTMRRAERGDLATQVSQGVQARIPGLRESVPAAQDPLGREIANDQRGARALHPFRPSQERPDATIQAFLDAGIDIGKPPTSFTVDDVKIEMTPEQQRQYQRYMGEAIEKGIDRAAGASDRLRAQKLKQLLDDARASAASRIQADIGRSEIRSRVRERRAS